MLLVKLAFRNIQRQRRRTLLTLLSMSGGYALSCLSLSLAEGSYKNIIALFTTDHTGHLQVHLDDYLQRPKVYKGLTDSVETRQLITSLPWVRAVAPRVFAPVLAYAGNQHTPAQLIGVDPVLERQATRLADKVQQGQYFDSEPSPDNRQPAMLGLRIAQSLNITVGDDVILISQGADGSVANDIYRVDALVGTRDSWDSRNVYLPMEAAQEFLAMSGRVHEYAVMLHDIDQVSRVAATLQQRLTTLTIDTWMQVEPTFYSSMETDKRGNRVSLLIILFIVFIGVLNTVLMSVMERTNEFGVLRAIGSRPTKIFQLIVIETLMLALISIFIGAIVVAPLIAWFTLQGYPLPDPIDIGGIKFKHMLGDFSAYVFVAPMIIILTFALLVSIPPGIRAARITPTRAMSNL